MTVDREQIRRDAERFDSPNLTVSDYVENPLRLLAAHCRALLAELEQAERDLDIERAQHSDDVDDLEARLAKVPALVEATTELLDYYQNPEAKRSTDRLIELEDALSEALTAWERE